MRASSSAFPTRRLPQAPSSSPCACTSPPMTGSAAFPGFYPYQPGHRAGNRAQRSHLADDHWRQSSGLVLSDRRVGSGHHRPRALHGAAQQREYLWIFLLFSSPRCIRLLQFYLLFHNLPIVVGSISTAAFRSRPWFSKPSCIVAFLRMPVKRWLRIVLVLSVLGILYGSGKTASGIGIFNRSF